MFLSPDIGITFYRNESTSVFIITFIRLFLIFCGIGTFDESMKSKGNEKKSKKENELN